MIAAWPTPIQTQLQRARMTMGQIAETITGRDYLSHSQISAYQSCPLKWWFSYVAQARPEFISAAMLFGSSIHSAVQRHLEALIAHDQPPTLDELMTAYRDHWQAESNSIPVRFGKTDNFESLTNTAKETLKEFLASPYAHPEGEILGIEETLRIQLADDLPDLVAKVDLIEYRRDELVITDYKTSRSMWTPDTAFDHAEQLVLYGHAAQPIARDLKVKTRLQFVVLTKTKKPQVDSFQIEYGLDPVERTRTVVRHVFRAMKAGMIYPAPSTMNCGGCPFQKRCKSWHRETGR